MIVPRGLVVGKFCPLHDGHRLLLDTARADSEQLVIISYMKPEHALCPRARRDAWLAALYPDAVRLVVDDAELTRRCRSAGVPTRTVPQDDAPEAEHREFCGWLCRDLLGTTVDAVFTSEDYGDGFADALSAFFGGPVRHICVDKLRVAVPISGTRLREDTSLHARFLREPVRASLVLRVAILGGESTGKTTLAAALATRLGTVWVPEYGRDLWEAKDGALTFDDMLAIGRTQVEREDRAAAQAAGWLVCDTTPLTTAFYSEQMFGRVAAELMALAARTYDRTLLCAPDIAFVQDGTRQDAAFRRHGHDWHDRELAFRGVAVTQISGPLQTRVDAAIVALI